METDAEASGIQSWLFGFVSVTLTTIQTHRFPTSFSRMGSLPMRRVRIGSVDTKKSVIPSRNSTTPGYFRMREQNNPRPLAFEACLNSREIRTSVGTLHPALFSTPNWGNSRAWLFWSRLRTVYYQSLWCRRQSMHVFASFAGA